MNTKLNELINVIVNDDSNTITEMHFHYDDDENVWCISGTDDGLYFETDDVEAVCLDVAVADAIEHLAYEIVYSLVESNPTPYNETTLYEFIFDGDISDMTPQEIAAEWDELNTDH